MIRTKGEAGTGDIVEAVRHMRAVMRGSASSRTCARTSSTPRPRSCARRSTWCGRPPSSVRCTVANFTPAALPPRPTRALMRQLGAEAVFVGSGIFKSESPER